MNASLVFYIGKKLAHFVKEFEAYSPEVGEFDAENDSRGVVIESPVFPDDPAKHIYIDFGEEFVLYWNGWHTSYSPEDFWYDILVSQLHKILSGDALSAVVTDEKGNVVMSTVFEAKNTLSSAEDIFIHSSTPDFVKKDLREKASLCTVTAWTGESYTLPIK